MSTTYLNAMKTSEEEKRNNEMIVLAWDPAMHLVNGIGSAQNPRLLSMRKMVRSLTQTVNKFGEKK